MPILLIFLLTAACLPIEWCAPPFGLGVWGSAGLTAAAVALPLAAALALRTWAVRTLRGGEAPQSHVARVYSRLRRALFFVNIGAVALAVLGLGWGWTVQQLLAMDRPDDVPQPDRLLPFAELAVPLPYFLIVFGCWLIYYDAERMLAAGPDGRGRFWSRAGYFFHHLRQLALLVGLPVGMFVTQQSVARLDPVTTRADWYRVASIAVLPVVIVLMPLVIKPLLGLRPMPAGPTRDRIEAVAHRLHFRFTDLLVWHTHGFTANAMIVGLVPRIRYVIFTDRLLDEMPPDELQAVFGHEVGHARHGHIWYYGLFLLLSMTVIAALVLLTHQFVKDTYAHDPGAWYVRLAAENGGWVALPPVVVAAAYIFLVFGFLSRRCERQADVAGCRAVSCANPHCTGHDLLTVYAERGNALCPTGIRTFARALERVELMNGLGGPDPGEPRSLGDAVRAVFGWLRAWQHSTIPRRVGFLLSVIDDRGRERRFQRRLKVLRWGLVLGLTAALVALGEAVGWRELLAAI